MKLFNGYIEENILSLLLKEGDAHTSHLLERVNSTRACTRQGFYRALRKLRDDEHVVIHRSLVSVNKMWLRRLQVLVQSSVAGRSVIGDMGKLGVGEKLELTFKGLSAMDRLWSHLFSNIELTVPLKHPLFLFNPHNWSALLRTETDKAHEETLRERQRPSYLVIGSATELDKEVTRAMDFRHLEFSFNPRLTQQSYIAVLGDYAIEVRLSPTSRKAIDSIFRNYKSSLEARRAMEKIDPKIVCKILIEKEPVKAREWSRRIARDFHIPKRYRP